MAVPAVVSHRTHMGAMPENTLAGIEAALAAGVDGIEVDVRASADGALVLVHDATLERTAGLGAAVADLSHAEVREVRVPDPFGRLEPQPIPTLDEALAAIAGRAFVVIDVCASGLVESIERCIRAAGAEPWCRITTPDAEEAAAFARALPGARTLLTVPRRLGHADGVAHALAVAREAGLAGVNPDHRVLTPAFVGAASDAGLEVATWTVNDPADIARVLALPVVSVTSDHPERVMALAAAARAGAGAKDA